MYIVAKTLIINIIKIPYFYVSSWLYKIIVCIPEHF